MQRLKQALQEIEIANELLLEAQRNYRKAHTQLKNVCELQSSSKKETFTTQQKIKLLVKKSRLTSLN